ncbi:2-succinyl-6-hydroxy-2,4-cyclohexadiene-1-carboxylate synthase [uncultured archaeon]|nr:2-succinyl-6-hydroxy-2,4-cyclohexadiene-1-carboxylate synthase [uncultured archaeon]
MRKVEFKNFRNEILRGFVHEPRKIKGAVILLHGFPGNCKSLKTLARWLKFAGFLTLRFDFSGTRLSEGNFEDKLMSKEVKEIKSSVDFLSSNYKFKKLYLIGFSTGAIDLSLYAWKDKRIDRIVLSGGVADLVKCINYDFNKNQIKEFKEKGFIVYSRPGSWYHNKRLKRGFYEEFFKLNVKNSLHKLKKPILILHGSKDTTVPIENAKEIYDAANEPKKLMIIKGADHKFSKLRHKLKSFREIVKFFNNDKIK